MFEFTALKWSLHPPDLNLIENLWDVVERDHGYVAGKFAATVSFGHVKKLGMFLNLCH